MGLGLPTLELINKKRRSKSIESFGVEKPEIQATNSEDLGKPITELMNELEQKVSETINGLEQGLVAEKEKVANLQKENAELQRENTQLQQEKEQRDELYTQQLEEIRQKVESALTQQSEGIADRPVSQEMEKENPREEEYMPEQESPRNTNQDMIISGWETMTPGGKLLAYQRRIQQMITEQRQRTEKIQQETGEAIEETPIDPTNPPDQESQQYYEELTRLYQGKEQELKQTLADLA